MQRKHGLSAWELTAREISESGGVGGSTRVFPRERFHMRGLEQAAASWGTMRVGRLLDKLKSQQTELLLMCMPLNPALTEH